MNCFVYGNMGHIFESSFSYADNAPTFVTK